MIFFGYRVIHRRARVNVTSFISVVTAYGLRHYTSLTRPLNPPPQVGDLGR